MNQLATESYDRDQLSGVIASLIQAMDSLWKIIDLNRVRFLDDVKDVTTQTKGEVYRLPKSGAPVRGLPGVTVSRENHKLTEREYIRDRIEDTLYGPKEWQRTMLSGELIEKWDQVVEKANPLYDVIRTIPKLRYRIGDWLGAKTYESNELDARVAANVEALKHQEIAFLASVLSAALAADGYSVPRKLPFGIDEPLEGEMKGAINNADVIATDAVERIEAIAARTQNHYDVVVALNAPVVDSEHPLPLIDVALAQTQVGLTIGRVSDELLTRLYRHNKGLSLDRINLTISFRNDIGVNENVGAYETVYSYASRVAENVVDCLRIVRKEDIGVMAIEVLPIEDGMPLVRSTLEARYDPSHAPSLPHRFVYEVAPAAPLNDTELNTVRELMREMPRVTETEGLEVALRRFRSSCDRYVLDDPERLLDMAFAFEALFLNDGGDNKDLSYRLRLRTARFLDDDIDTRLETFGIMNEFYGIRSKIAHGEALDLGSQAKKDKLRRCQDRVPELLRRSLAKMIRGDGPQGVEKADQSEWWQRLELK